MLFSYQILNLAEELIHKTKTEEERINITTVYRYLKAGGGIGVSLLVLVCILLAVGSQAFLGYWLSVWTNSGSGVRFRSARQNNICSNSFKK